MPTDVSEMTSRAVVARLSDLEYDLKLMKIEERKAQTWHNRLRRKRRTMEANIAACRQELLRRDRGDAQLQDVPTSRRNPRLKTI